MRFAAVALAAFVLSAPGAVARTIDGTPGPDRLVGTVAADVIRGRGGGDLVSGGAGADFLQGDGGRDTIVAGAGSDRVSAEYDAATDSVTCGDGLDVVNADLRDRVATDCELVGRRLSRDPYTTPDAQHETQVEPDSFTVGSTTVTTFQVGRRFDGAATNVGYAVTRDSGRTWASGLLPGLTVASRPAGANARASDPVVAYDAAHRVWLISTLALAGTTTRLAINRSTDGATWSNALVAVEETLPQGIAFDKNWLTCDNTPTSPYFGRCYLAFTHASDEDALAVSTSNDGGTTWSSPVEIGAAPAVGVFPVVKPNGELVVAYLWERGRFAISASRSADGGVTFDPPVRIAQIDGSCAIRGFRAFPLPSADVDAQGRVWVAWHDCAAPGASRNAAFVSSSADGVTWTPPAPVSANRNALLPAIGIDRATGRVAIAYHRFSAAGVDVELVESRAGGIAFGAPRRLSARSMRLEWMPNTTSGRMLADYISVHYGQGQGRPLAVWVLASEPVGARFRQAVYATRG